MLAATLLFLSGAAALIYQVLWIKQLSLVVGIDVYAVTTGVSAFFAGLGLGGFAFGRLADTAARPLRLYAMLEAITAILGVAATVAFAHSAFPFTRLEAAVGPAAWVLPLALVGIPALAMGGTIPVLMRYVLPARDSLGGIAGRLYAANTSGAVVGSLLAPFFLLPVLGVRGSAVAAGGLNLVAALIAFMADRAIGRAGPVVAVQEPDVPSKEGRLALTLYSVAGGIALGYEVLWSQTIVQFLSTRAFAFAIVLATYLAGLVTGSAIYGRFADRVRDKWATLGVLLASASLLAILPIAVTGTWLLSWQSALEHQLRMMTGNELIAMCGRFAVAALWIVFPATVVLGAAFPAALKLVAKPNEVGRDTGAVLALNTAGGIAGTLLTGFVFIPAFGLLGTLGILAFAGSALGLIAATCKFALRQGRSKYIVTGLVAITTVVAIVTPKDLLAKLLPRTRSGGKVVFYRENPGGTVAVVEQQAGPGKARRLYIQGVSNSGDTMTSLRYMRLQALLPLLIHNGEPQSALVIGYGTGITTGALLTYPGLTRRVCAELLPAVAEASPLFTGNLGAASDPRIDLQFRDGRRELIQSSEKYDLITLEPPPPSAAGVANLYSTDFYKLARERLNAEGIVAQWWPLATQNDEDSRSLVKSFLDSFPYASLWTTEIHEMLLIGSSQAIALSIPRIDVRFNNASVRDALGEVGVSSPEALLATWVTDRKGLEAYASRARPVTDDRPTIEYGTWLRRGEFVGVLPRVLSFRTDPPVEGADDKFRAKLDQERGTLMNFYDAALDAYRGKRTEWARALGTVMKADPDNPYYRWFVGTGKQ